MKYTLALLIVTAASSPAATLTIVMSNNNNAFNLTNPFQDSAGSNLANGDLVQLGYFEIAGTPGNNGGSFDSFVAVESVSFAVGADGKFTDQVTLDDQIDLPGTNSQTLQFGLRIFDASTSAAATFFNTVTDDEWQFSFSTANPPPTPSELNLVPSFGAENPVWQDAGAPLQTSIAIPEPSTSLTALLGLAFLTGKRRRK
ncbi:MAG: PEP-CTERM sorting domain-containing protein [Akkermansiaceae bacterium]|nr:PEP-CTERM sorting domain-containing protein [Akkermansiaceae bacterium]MDG2323622.1 PEP-CTERM sorting domain-containing protein [Akkermansiaceae bacterium]